MTRNLVCVSIFILTLVLALQFLPSSEAKREATYEAKLRTKLGSAPQSRQIRSTRQQVSPTPILKQAVAFGRSRPIAQLAREPVTVSETDRILIKDHEEEIERALEKKADEKEESERYEEEEDEKIREKNRRNVERIRQIDENAKGTPDAAIARVPSLKGITPRAEIMPTPSVSFEAISLKDTTALPGQGFLPPDTVGEIGPNHFVQMVNSALRIYSRTGTPLTPLMSIGAIFAAISGPCAGNEDGDPIVIYDQLADRWLLSEFCTEANPNTHQLIAISQTSDPTGSYYLYDFMMPNNKFNDYPKFGLWSDAYYMTDNQFNQAGTQSLGAGIFAFDRSKMIAGDPSASFIYFDLANGCPGACEFGGMLPADLDGFAPPPIGAPASIVQFDADEFGATDSLRIFDVHADFATPANSTLIERVGSPLPVAAFDPREVPFGSRNVIPQPAPGVAVDAISDRLMFRLAYRNFGSHESLVMNHTVNAAINPVFRAGVRYYELRKTSSGAAWTVQEQATMAGPAGDTVHRWMASSALNGAGSLAIGYSASSTTLFPSIRYAGRLESDPAGSLSQGEAILVDGTSAQTHSSGRWGDYSDLTVDPVDDCTFWYTQQYVTGASAPDNTRWHTRVGAFQFGPCVPVPKGILSGAVTSSVDGASIANAKVVAGPFIRSSNGSGNYSIDPIGIGTYTVFVSAPGYLIGTIPNVTITLGATTTIDVQLVPQNILNAGMATLAAESCTPANSVLDAGETVTMNLPISNIGGSGASTTNLIATLQPTGGVSAPSGPQNYGAVAQGAPAVIRPFTFTASVTCGEVIIATLHLMDGSNDLGNITYVLQTGTPSAAISSGLYTTGNISIPITDLGTTNVPIPITDTGSITDVNVSVRLNHSADGDLALSLIAPDGTTVPLSLNRGGSGDNFGSGTNDCAGNATTFDDGATSAITAGVAPFNGSFKPESPLSAFNGRNIQGTWTVRVADSAPGDTGVIGCVRLEIKRHRYLCCGVAGTPFIEANGNPVITVEGFSPANGAPDPGEGITALFPLINTGDGNATNLIATLQNSAGVTPIAPASQSYGAVAVAGTATQPFNFVAHGVCGDLISATIHLQDGAVDLGNLTYTFRLGTVNTTSHTFSNTAPITIPAAGTGATGGAAATPYPSNIIVSGAPSTISKVVVTLNSFSHTFPDDVDVLLVSPSGRKMIIMSDAGDDPNVTNLNITLDDDAAALLPDATGLSNGSFKPASYLPADAFPAPAPAAPYLTPATEGTDTFTAAFTGAAGGNPNGVWSLYVVDDAAADTGGIGGGWSLTLISATNVCVSPSAAPASLSGAITADGAPLGGVTIKLAGETAATTITNNAGNYFFANLATSKFYTVTPSLANYHFSPANRSFSLLSNVTDAGFTGTREATASSNAIDSTEYFVRQQYLDFLSREPDQGGLNYWSEQLNNCGSDSECVKNRRVDISAAFFIEREFQRTGSFIFQLYKGVLGRRLTYAEFAADRQLVVDGPDLEARKEAFADSFVTRPEFIEKYSGKNTAESFVDSLLQTVRAAAGLDLSSQRVRLIERYNSATSMSKARSLVVKDVAENGDFAQATYNKAFVLMEYFGYLRREPDQGGYDFWLNVLNNREPGNYRGMVCAFITSAEYQARFGSVITRSNADCGQ